MQGHRQARMHGKALLGRQTALPTLCPSLLSLGSSLFSSTILPEACRANMTQPLLMWGIWVESTGKAVLWCKQGSL